MAWTQTFSKITSLTENQEGFVSRQQLLEQGLSVPTITRLIGETGVLNRVARGVYRLKGAPWNNYEDLYAAWFQITQSSPVEAEVCVSHYWAAYLQRVGVYAPKEFEFTSIVPRTSPRNDVKIYCRPVARNEWTVVNGMPVTKPMRIASDLLELGLPPAEIGRLIYDSLASSKSTPIEMAESCFKHAGKYGMDAADPAEFLEYLLRESQEIWQYQSLWIAEVESHFDILSSRETLEMP